MTTVEDTRPGRAVLDDPLVHAARALTTQLLSTDARRVAHSLGVARQAARLAGTVDAEQRPRLLAAAWLHDVGYAAAVRDTGFHPIDGARALRVRGWPDDIVRLVAHHSGSWFVAAELGLDGELAAFPALPGPVADALTAADQTTDPVGRPRPFEARVQDMLERHGADSPQARAHHRRSQHLRSVIGRVAERLARAGADPDRYGLGPAPGW